ncbi:MULTISPECIES: hypothetical protein [Bordetella]|uniref:Uncharacterized protein n=2 Tax=Bordetella TaxID=517 RepID=A0A261VX43_9BORD|nr:MULTISPECIES: hypothetical protein [Bordetella]MDM9560264.1 hypothetical protein [Bordetella petrii]OZI78351.1 hypothetical protein CAL24_09515 [Bordetella genomosp. 2]
MSVFKRRIEERHRRLLAAQATEQDVKAGREAALRALEAEAGALLETIIQYLEVEKAEAKAGGYMAEVHRIRDDHSSSVGAELSFAYVADMLPSQVTTQFGFRITIGEDRQVQVSYVCRERGQRPLTLIPTEAIGATDQAGILPRIEASLEKFVEAAEQAKAGQLPH